MKIIIIIATHKREESLKNLLNSIKNCNIPNVYLEIIVVENGVKGHAESICKNISFAIPLRYLYVACSGQSNARKYALEMADKAAFIIFFDDDITCAPGIISSYASAAQKYGKGFFYGGPVLPNYEKSAPHEKLLNFFPPSVKGFSPYLHLKIVENPIFLGANWGCFASEIVKYGNFNPELGPGGRQGCVGHETDIQKRLLSNGMKGVYIPDATVWHYVPSTNTTFKWLKKRYYKHGVYNAISTENKKDCKYIGPIPRWFVRKFISQFFYYSLWSCYPMLNSRKIQNILSFHYSLGKLKYHIKTNKVCKQNPGLPG